MADDRVSNELLAEMLEDARSEAERIPRDDTVYDFEPEHIVAALTELENRRASDRITAEWIRDTAMNVMLATEVDEAIHILSKALSCIDEQSKD